MKKVWIRFLLFFVSIPPLSRIWGLITRLKHPRFLIKRIIKKFHDHHQIDMKDYKNSPADYLSLSDFFLRPLDQNQRPLIKNNRYILSPSDGYLQHYQHSLTDRVTQVKGMYYLLSDLIHNKIDFSEGWWLSVIYLSPADYHRFHYPISGTISGYCHKKGPLYPVNSMGLNNIKGLFVKNERIILKFEKNKQFFYQVAVGATFVGSIKIEFIKKTNRNNYWQPFYRPCQQMDEMGCFRMGSTIVLLTPKTLAEPLPDMLGKKIKVGEPLLKLIT